MTDDTVESLRARITELEGKPGASLSASDLKLLALDRENAALSARLEQVRDVLDEYCTAGCCQHAESNEKQLHDLLLTALDGEQHDQPDP